MKRIHFMGILGSGCSATAIIAKYQGHEVSGCDVSAYSEYEDEIQLNTIDYQKSHDPSHLENIDMLVISPAISHYDNENAELASAREHRIPIITWQQFSGEVLQKDKFVIAIAGTHGKSTTTAMTAQIFETAGLDPTVQLGAVVPKWHSNYRVGKSRYYIIEADEYGNNFLNYKPDILAITNIEYDHPEYFKTEKEFINAFQKLTDHVKPNGKIFGSIGVSEMLEVDSITSVDISKNFALTVTGDFNQENARIAYTIAINLGVEPLIAEQALSSYAGLYRRMSLLGEVDGIKVYDDYGHHPTAVVKSAQAIREKFPKNRIWLVFQPHMFTRTKILFKDFVAAFSNLPIDHIILADIFPSREHDTGEISSKQVVDAVSKPNVLYGSSLDQIGKMLLEKVKYADVVVNMGAGDITTLSTKLINDLKKKNSKHENL